MWWTLQTIEQNASNVSMNFMDKWVREWASIFKSCSHCKFLYFNSKQNASCLVRFDWIIFTFVCSFIVDDYLSWSPIIDCNAFGIKHATRYHGEFLNALNFDNKILWTIWNLETKFIPCSCLEGHVEYGCHVFHGTLYHKIKG
jgi:hypothetical protein